MIFDESFFQLTGGKLNYDDEDLSNEKLDDLVSIAEQNAKKPEEETKNESDEIDFDSLSFGDGDVSDVFNNDEPPTDSDALSRDYVIESDLVVPKIKRLKVEREKPVVLVIDDDFEMLDLLKIYLMRDYEYKAFSGPKEAIFYLNENVPDLIFIDCYIHSIKAARVVDIIHSYKELADVPIYYICEEYERGALERRLPEGVKGLIERPIARGKLQDILDVVFPKKDKEQKKEASTKE